MPFSPAPKCGSEFMRLGVVLRKYRIMEERTLRELGKEIGISAAAVLRIEQGRGCDAATFMKVLIWLTK